MSKETQWTIATLKEYLESVINEREASILKACDRISEILEGFPQEYSRKEEFEVLRTQMELIRTDHVQRREFEVLKDAHTEGRGARTTMIASAGIIVTLIAVAFGATYANQLTAREVSAQISTEAPWLTDKPSITARLRSLEQQVVTLKLQLGAHETTDKIRASKK